MYSTIFFLKNCHYTFREQKIALRKSYKNKTKMYNTVKIVRVLLFLYIIAS